MSARTATDSSSPVFPFDGVAPCQPWKAHAARLTSRWLTPSVAAISAHGEIEASNAGNLADYARCVLAHCPQCRCLILDLGGLDFLGTEGISTMHTVRPRRGALRAGTQRGRSPSAADLRSRERDHHRHLSRAVRCSLGNAQAAGVDVDVRLGSLARAVASDPTTW